MYNLVFVNMLCYDWLIVLLIGGGAKNGSGALFMYLHYLPINWQKKQLEFLAIRIPYRMHSSLDTTSRIRKK